MQQPIKNKAIIQDLIKEKDYILLIDGTNLLKISMVDTSVNSRGELIGPILQFLIQIKKLLYKRDFKQCYVFWDSELSGLLKYNYYSDYKKNRDKLYSEYDQNVKQFMSFVLNKNKAEKEIEKLEFEKVKHKLMEYLEELSIRQVSDIDGTESDDLIAYFVLNNKNKYIYIYSTDSDLEQLLTFDNVIIYNSRLREFLHKGNYKKIKGINVENVCLFKTLLGETSDNIKGIKGLGKKTLLDNFPEIIENPISIEEIIEKAKIINENRINGKPKLKPLKWCENIINKVTDGIQGEKIFEINEKIINLRKPLLSDNAIKQMDEIMYTPLDPNDRDMKNLYKLIDRDDILDLKGENRFSGFFITFKKLIDNEIEFYKKNV